MYAFDEGRSREHAHKDSKTDHEGLSPLIPSGIQDPFRPPPPPTTLQHDLEILSVVAGALQGVRSLQSRDGHGGSVLFSARPGKLPIFCTHVTVSKFACSPLSICGRTQTHHKVSQRSSHLPKFLLGVFSFLFSFTSNPFPCLPKQGLPRIHFTEENTSTLAKLFVDRTGCDFGGQVRYKQFMEAVGA